MNIKWIKKFETDISVLQGIGLILILLGIITLCISAFFHGGDNSNVPSIIAASFFITMLGVSFAFPTLLEGNEGLSTMRIVVFMVTNVICMLLLKIGWAKGISSLEGIGLDQNWMGVIAFVFGAKATQSFFESRVAVPKETPKQGMAALEYTNADVAKLAVAQNEEILKTKFPNIISVSDAVQDLNSTDSHVIAIYLKDNETTGIPDKLEVKMPNNGIKLISTEIIRSLGKSKIQIHQGNDIRTLNSSSFGSVGCFIGSENDNNFIAIATAGHVCTQGRCINKGGALSGSDRDNTSIGNLSKGEWHFQLLTSNIDIAFAQIHDFDLNSDNQIIRFNNLHYLVSDSDSKKTAVKLEVKSGIKTGYILDSRIGIELEYNDGNSKIIKNIILIGDTTDRDKSTSLTVGGDSGGCVYVTENNRKKLLGLVLGGDKKFTYVLSIKETLDSWGYKII